ncbi:MAG: hypothetical protein P1P89_17105 [Desulfobacterales bacterium]|nr:hypothetical protein [Desulfobacterales bacterium]
MKSLEYRLEVLKKILLQRYHEKEKLELDVRWQANVMRRVRILGALQLKPDPLVQFGQFAWRLTPITCLLIIVSAAVLLKFDFTPDFNVLISFITDAEEVSLVQLLPL